MRLTPGDAVTIEGPDGRVDRVTIVRLLSGGRAEVEFPRTKATLIAPVRVLQRAD